MSILLPSLNKAKEKARQTMCANRLKQLGMGTAGYVNDYNGFVFRTAPVYQGVYMTWYTFLGYYQHYISDNYAVQYSIMRCPSQKSPVYWYGMNYNTFWKERRIGTCQWPSNLILFADSVPNYFCGAPIDSTQSYRITPSGIDNEVWEGVVSFHHNNNCNVLWLDLSVRARIKGRIPGDYPNASWRANYTSEWNFANNKYDSYFSH